MSEQVFRKTASAAAIATEVASLAWLGEATATGGAAVAEVMGHGKGWLETRRLTFATPSPDAARDFGQRLAMTHAAGAPFLGAAPPGLPPPEAVLADLPSPVVDEPTFFSWGAFFAALRLAPHMHQAQAAGSFDSSQAKRIWRLIDRVADGEFDADQPQAVRAAQSRGPSSGSGLAVARVHGDLWKGNVVFACDERGTTATLIDPSAHGGHAETDLAELAVFGAPHLAHTIGGYNEVSALADGWQERLPINQLHMLLVHVVKFGEGYVPWTVDLTTGFS